MPDTAAIKAFRDDLYTSLGEYSSGVMTSIMEIDHDTLEVETSEGQKFRVVVQQIE